MLISSMSHDGKGLSGTCAQLLSVNSNCKFYYYFHAFLALYARDSSLSNNSEDRNSESSRRKRSRFDEVGNGGGGDGELGRDSRSESANASASRDEYRERDRNRERSDRTGRDSRDSRDLRDSRDSRDYTRYREREREYRSSREPTESKAEDTLERSRESAHAGSSSRDYRSSRDHDYDSGDKSSSKRVREDRDYDSHRASSTSSRYRDDRGYGDRHHERDRDRHDRDRYERDLHDRDRNSYQRHDRRNNNVEIPFDKFLKLSPWRGPVTPLEERVKHLKNWDVAPAGFERISADKAKLTGLFPPPGNIAKTSNYVPPTLDPARAAMFQMLNRDAGSSAATAALDTGANLPANLAKQARRFYVGNLPYEFTESSLMSFLETNLRGLSGRASGDTAVLSITVSTDRTYAFVECKTSEDASMAMSLDGVVYEGAQLKIRRPKEYHMALTTGQLGSSGASNTVNQTAATNGLITTQIESQAQLIMSGIPDVLTAEHVKSLLLLVTDLRSFLLLKDRETGKSLGTAIFEFVEDAEGLEWSDPFLKHSKGSLFMGPFEMKIQRVSTLMSEEGDDASGGDSEYLRNLLSVYNLQPGYATAPTSTSVLQLLNIVSRESLLTDYEAIYQDLKQELEKQASSEEIELVVPRPAAERETLVPGVGKVFVKFGSVEGAARAASELAGRIFDGHTCIVSFYPEDKFAKRLF